MNEYVIRPFHRAMNAGATLDEDQLDAHFWNSAIDAVMEEFRALPPSKVGDAEFLRRLSRMKELV